MNKAELISAMAAESGLSKTDSKKALDAFIASVTKAMKAGDKVSVYFSRLRKILLTKA